MKILKIGEHLSELVTMDFVTHNAQVPVLTGALAIPRSFVLLDNV